MDNASTDNTVAIAEEAGIEVIQTGANLVYAGALNVASPHLDPDRPVLVLNPDLSVEPDAVTALLEAARADPLVGIVVPAILDRTGSSTHRSDGSRRCYEDWWTPCSDVELGTCREH